MKTSKLYAVAAVGLMALGVGKAQAQIDRLPFQVGDVQSLNVSLVGVMQVTNYNNGRSDIALIKGGRLNNNGLLELLGQAYYGDDNAFARSGRIYYQPQIYLQSTNYYQGSYESDWWTIQVVKVDGKNRTVVLDTHTANAFVPAGQSGAYADFSINVDNGPLHGRAGINGGAGLMMGEAWFDFYYEYYDTNDVYNQPFDIYGSGAIRQNYAGNSRGNRYSFTIMRITGENEPKTNGVNYIDAIIHGGSMTGNGSDNGHTNILDGVD